ncbi:Unannotated [Lentimonas sp. CC19]|nr:Unannotated [Lentimonas sp. CC19]CAA6696995.1 Unannotated [Lentimonas sp. CC10]CAA7071019.1 Unannotated [Lentimonas sp. CC11]
MHVSQAPSRAEVNITYINESPHAFNRPYGTRNITISSPTINRGAILKCPSGTKKGQRPYEELVFTDSF